MSEWDMTTPRKALWQAMLSVQGKVAKVRKDSKNPHFKNTYASLEAVWDTLRQHLQAAGLVVSQMPGQVRDGHITVQTVVAHAESGETLSSAIQVPIAKPDAQGVGSAITYACRYSLMAVFGLPPTDDDGEAARHDNPREVKRYAPDGTPVPTLAEAMESCAESIAAIRKAFEEGDDPYALQVWSELSAAEKMALWVAPSKGGPFTTEQRNKIHSMRKNAA